MKHKIFILILIQALTLGLYAQSTMQSPVDLGTNTISPPGNITLLIEPYARKTPVTPNMSSNQNYILTRTYTSENGMYYMDAIQYYDGLGRPSQSVQVGISPNQSDLVGLQEYDNFGRESKAWLPAIAQSNRGAFLADFTGKSGSTYNNTTYNSAADSEPYAYPIYESSPLNRVIRQFGPGVSWHTGSGKAINTEYLTNSNSYTCAYYYVEGDSLKRDNNYGNGQLYVTKITDEEGNISYEFKDKLDRVVLQRQMNSTMPHDTYYVYDDFGNLRFVLPPLAADATGNGTYTESTEAIKNYAYVYKYDARNRCIRKQLPGCDPVYYVYDKADRLIFSQDGEQRLKGEWLFTIPDALGRTAVSGICKNALSWNSNPLQNIIAKAERSGNTDTFKGYTISGITLSTPVILSVNYYDNYGFMGKNNIPNTAFDTSAGSEFNKQYTGSYTGLSTGTLTAVLDGASAPSQYLYSIIYYDFKGQAIQIITNNHLGGTEKEFLAYNFAGQLEKRKHVHTASGQATQTEIYAYDYDHAERLARTKYTLNANAEILMSENTYDELGRLKTTTPLNLQNLKSTYAYNIRWTSQISSSPYIEDLTYMYNGNIATMQWIQGGVTRKYTFAYDGLSRLSRANYNKPGEEEYYTSYTYDKHGNFTELARKGLKTSGRYSDIDLLTLYYNKSNQLKYIYDNGERVMVNNSYDFKDYSSASVEYAYNTNGAMTKDMNKGVSEITYNTLNLPLKVDIKSPVAEARNEYTYSAAGKKMKVVSRWNPTYSTNPIIGSGVNTGSLTSSKTTDYVGSFIYENNVLKKILTDNGYYENGNYYFYIKNHLGSNVVVVKQDGSIVQNDHYYPFGLPMAISDNQGVQSYKYTGKELDMEHGLMQYDYEARQYDPAIGRFTTMDPMAEKYYSISPYAYCMNNPINAVDLRGDTVTITHRTGFLGMKKMTLRYDNRKLYNKDGSSYTGKIKGFLGNTVNALNKIRSGNAGNELIGKLQDSKRTYNIISGSNSYNTKDRTISWNSNNKQLNMPNADGSTGRPSYIGLTHELGHAWDHDVNGAINIFTEWYKSGNGVSVTQSEKISTWWENRVRSENGLPLRSHYSFDASSSTWIPERQGQLLIGRYSAVIDMIGKIQPAIPPTLMNYDYTIPWTY